MSEPCMIPNAAQAQLGDGRASNLTFAHGYTPIVIGAAGEQRMMPYLSIQNSNFDLLEQIRQDLRINHSPTGNDIYLYYSTRPQEVTNYCVENGTINAPGNRAEANQNPYIGEAPKSPSSNGITIEPGGLDITGFRQRRTGTVAEESVVPKKGIGI